MRSPEKENELTLLGNVLVLKVDIQCKASIEADIATTIAKYGKIDTLAITGGMACSDHLTGYRRADPYTVR